VLVFLFLIPALAGCQSEPVLSGGILVTFDVEGEIYKIFITNKDTIADVFAVAHSESMATIPNGKIIGESVFYNKPWSWYIDPKDIQMAEFTIEYVAACHPLSSPIWTTGSIHWTAFAPGAPR
jgi:hypothetical protein